MDFKPSYPYPRCASVSDFAVEFWCDWIGNTGPLLSSISGLRESWEGRSGGHIHLCFCCVSYSVLLSSISNGHHHFFFSNSDDVFRLLFISPTLSLFFCSLHCFVNLLLLAAVSFFMLEGHEKMGEKRQVKQREVVWADSAGRKRNSLWTFSLSRALSRTSSRLDLTDSESVKNWWGKERVLGQEDRK